MFAFLAKDPRRSSAANKQASSSTLPLYSPITVETSDAASTTSSMADLPLSPDPLLLKPAQRHATTPAAPSSRSSSSTWLARPSLSRFLADFTLGFADGLTVPFALTAGLSSLGQTDMVIFAGMAEICAGSISMGIGGYLSAKGDASAAAAAGAAAAARSERERERDADAEEEARREDEKSGRVQVVSRYLAPLDLPPELLELVREHVSSRADVAAALAQGPSLDETDEDDDDEEDEDRLPPPVVSGLSVALGYLIGGSLPLAPYFVVSRVGDGLLWSFVVCIAALFAFGFVKDYVLHRQQQRQQQREAVWVDDKGLCGRDGSERWRDVRRSAWEGAQMVMLGSIAALAAVLCVRLFDGMGHGISQP